MFKLFQLAAAILGFLVQVIPIVKIAEEAFSGRPGSGADKKALVMGLAKVAVDAVEAGGNDLMAEHKEAVLKAVDVGIDAIVSVFNAAKVFIKSGN